MAMPETCSAVQLREVRSECGSGSLISQVHLEDDKLNGMELADASESEDGFSDSDFDEEEGESRGSSQPPEVRGPRAWLHPKVALGAAGAFVANGVRNFRSTVTGTITGDLNDRRVLRDKFSLDDLSREPWMLALAFWHTYALWMTMCIFVTVGGNLLLQWYIEWYRISLRQGQSRFPYQLYFATFVRSWIMVALAGEMVRFCYISFLDVWSKDTFGRYRRAVVGLGYLDISVNPNQQASVASTLMGITARATVLGIWPQYMLESRRRFVDKGVQVFIWVSFDVVPFLVGLITYLQYGQASVARNTGFALLTVGSTHALIFYMAWMVTDVCLKVCALHKVLSKTYSPQRRASQALRRLNSNRSMARTSVVRGSVAPRVSVTAPLPPVREAPVQRNNMMPGDSIAVESHELQFSGGAQQRPRPATSAETSSSNSNSERTPRDYRQWEALTRGSLSTLGTMLGNTVEDHLHCCVPCCGWLQVIKFEVVFHATWVGIILIGASVSSLMMLVGMVVAVLMWYVRIHMHQVATTKSQNRCAGFGNQWVEPMRLRALESWGRIHCRLDYESQTNAYMVFAVIVVLQGLMFSILQQIAGLIVCMIMLIFVIVRFRTMRMIKPWGWAVSFAEGLFITLLSVISNGIHGYGWFTFFLAVLRQFGLSRKYPSGDKVVLIVRVVLHVILLIVVGLALFADNENNTGGVYQWTSLCTPEKNCRYIEVDPGPPGFIGGRGQNYTPVAGLACEYRTTRRGTMMSLSDFGLFSLLAYEGNETLGDALQHYFPGWRLDYARYAADNTKKEELERDWTTFFEFSDPDNSTTIFAIRGTSDVLEMLNDVNIWLPAVIMQLFSMVGPEFGISMGEAVAWLCNAVQGSEHGRDYFQKLLSHVTMRVAAKDRKRYFLTGHSLGGGLAKLVASQVQIPAVTFAAPGLGLTGYIVLTEKVAGDLKYDTLTVVPDNDIVSRVDTQTGMVARTRCDGNFLDCHDLQQAICTIVETCGSGRSRDGATLMMPCGCSGERWKCPDATG